MARTVYIIAFAQQAGRSTAALGLMELLSARTPRVGFFRPLVAGGAPDPEIELIRGRYRIAAEPDELFGLTVEEAEAEIAAGRRDEAEKRILAAYMALEPRFDAIVIEGGEWAGANPGVQLELDAALANHLGAPVLALVRAATPEAAGDAVRVAREALTGRGCELFGVFVARVEPGARERARAAVAGADGDRAVYVLPEEPELRHPTVAEVGGALGAELLCGSQEEARRPVRAVRIAAMSVEHFLADLEPQTLVIVPGDRTDIVIACLATTLSAELPAVAGVLLTAGYPLDPHVRTLVERAPFPVLQTPMRSYAAATAVSGVRPVIRPEDERKVATALALFANHTDSADLERRVALERPHRITPAMFEYELVERARARRRHIVLPEGEDDRVLRAADVLLRRKVVDLTILGDVDAMRARAAALGLDLSAARLVDPPRSEMHGRFAEAFVRMRKHKGMTEELALETVTDSTYFATLMVHQGEADGMVSGASHTTGDTIRPAFMIIKARPGVSVVSSVFLMALADRVLVYGDCAVNPSPDARQLADIAISSAETAATFGVEPRIAMLSYSTGESARGPRVQAVKEATEVVRQRRPDLEVDGPMQYDAAVDAGVAAKKMPDSPVAGRATVFIFPDLDTGNIAYKAVQRSAGALAIGPVLQGLRMPVNDLSRGCSVADIVSTVVITAIQAQDADGKSSLMRPLIANPE